MPPVWQHSTNETTGCLDRDRPQAIIHNMENRELSTKNELKEHENTVHKGLTNHQCRICGRKYSRKSHLRIHIKNSHPDIDPSDIHAAMIHLEKL